MSAQQKGINVTSDQAHLRRMAIEELAKATAAPSGPHAAFHLEAARLYVALMDGAPAVVTPVPVEHRGQFALLAAPSPVESPAAKVAEFYQVMLAAGLAPHQVSPTLAGRYAGCSRQGAAKTLRKLRGQFREGQR